MDTPSSIQSCSNCVPCVPSKLPACPGPDSCPPQQAAHREASVLLNHFSLRCSSSTIESLLLGESCRIPDKPTQAFATLAAFPEAQGRELAAWAPATPPATCNPPAEGVCISAAASAPRPSLHTQEHPQTREQNCRRKRARVGLPGSLALPVPRDASRATCVSS